jgi:hypothetical protein
MRFIRYNPSNGYVIFYGYMADQFVQAEIDAGQPTLISDEVYDFVQWKVDLATKTVVKRSQEEIDAYIAQLNIPPVIPIVPSPTPPPAVTPQGE